MSGRPAVWIEAEDLKRRIDSAEDLTIVDVRGSEEFVGSLGHIPRSRNIPLGDFAERIDDLRPYSDGSVVLVCLTDKRSTSAANELRDAGFRDVPVLRGGMQRWNALGFDISRTESSPGSG